MMTYRMTGAPIIGVTAFIGMTESEGRVQRILQSKAIAEPQNIVAGRSIRWFSEPIIIRVMCGTASPMNAIGPQNAVVTAVSKPVDSNRSIRVRCTLMPRLPA